MVFHIFTTYYQQGVWLKHFAEIEKKEKKEKRKKKKINK